MVGRDGVPPGQCRWARRRMAVYRRPAAALAIARQGGRPGPPRAHGTLHLYSGGLKPPVPSQLPATSYQLPATNYLPARQIPAKPVVDSLRLLQMMARRRQRLGRPLIERRLDRVIAALGPNRTLV